MCGTPEDKVIIYYSPKTSKLYIEDIPGAVVLEIEITSTETDLPDDAKKLWSGNFD